MRTINLKAPTYNISAKTSLVVQWLRLCIPNAGAPDSIPGQRTRSCLLQQRSCELQVIHGAAKLKKKTIVLWYEVYTSKGSQRNRTNRIYVFSWERKRLILRNWLKWLSWSRPCFIKTYEELCNHLCTPGIPWHSNLLINSQYTATIYRSQYLFIRKDRQGWSWSYL